MRGGRELCVEAGVDGYLSKPTPELGDVLEVCGSSSPAVAMDAERSAAQNDAICVDDLLSCIDGDRVFLADLVELLRGSSTEQIETARTAIATGDAAALQSVGHAMRGALANLAAPRAAGIAGELEAMGKAGEISSAGAALSRFESELVRVFTALDGLCTEAVQ
ncbi:MAG: Hpt domain-containing protein [Terracidiphilus sp.]